MSWKELRYNFQSVAPAERRYDPSSRQKSDGWKRYFSEPLLSGSGSVYSYFGFPCAREGKVYSCFDTFLLDGFWLPWNNFTAAYALSNGKLFPYTQSKTLGVCTDIKRREAKWRMREAVSQGECLMLTEKIRTIKDLPLRRDVCRWARKQSKFIKEDNPGLFGAIFGEFSSDGIPGILVSGGAKTAQQNAELSTLKDSLPEIKELANECFGLKDSWDTAVKFLFEMELIKSINDQNVTTLCTEVILPDNLEGTTREALGVHGFSLVVVGARHSTKGGVSKKFGPDHWIAQRAAIGMNEPHFALFAPEVARKPNIRFNVESGEGLMLVYFRYEIGKAPEFMLIPHVAEEKSRGWSSFTFPIEMFHHLMPATLIRMHEDGLPEYRLAPVL
jgi:hypothetical protein